MNDPKHSRDPRPAVETAAPETRPAYEPPRVTRKKAVTRATLFTGRGGPTSAPPLVANP
jgi:hypothetical protein